MSTWNVRGWRNKVDEVVSEIRKTKSDITVLTETKKKGQGSEEISGFIHLYSGVDKDRRAQSGVSILVRKELKSSLKSWEQINERIIRLAMRWKGRDIEIVGVYAPSDGVSNNVKETFYGALDDLLEEIGSRKEVVLLGDFNAWTGTKVCDKVVGQYGDDRINDSGERLIEFCGQHSLKIWNGFFQHRDIHKYTWVQPSGNNKTIIDYVMTRQHTAIKVEDVRVMRGPECGSDHHLVRARCYLPFCQRQLQQDMDETAEQSNTPEVPVYNVEALKDDSISFLYKLRLDSKLRTVMFSSAVNMYRDIIRNINEAAYESLGGITRRRKKDTPPWWTCEIETAVEDKKKAYHKWLCSGDPDDRRIYARYNREAKNLVTKAKNTLWENKCNEINNLLGSTKSREAWKVVKGLRTNKREISGLCMIGENAWKRHYTQLLTESRPQYLETEVELDEVEYDANDEVTAREVEAAIKSLKNNKAIGPGGVPNELLKHGPKVLFELLAYIFTLFYQEQDLPQEWTEAYMSNIYKKGDRKDCNNYRGLSVVNSISRVYGRLIRDKIEKEMRDIEEQNGFRAGRSCIDSLFTLKQVVEKRLDRGLQTHVVFVDLTKAYDSVPLMKLWPAMENQGISPKNINAVKKLYKNVTARIKVGGKLTGEVTVNKGLKQGCCISPTLFKVYLNEALTTWRKKCRGMGVRIGDDTLYTLHFADDQAILAEDEADVDYMLRKLDEEYSKWGLTINASKTEYLVVGGEADDLQIGSGKIKGTKSFKYLGVKITSTGGSNEEISARLGRARAVTRQLNSLLWSRRITRNNKRRIYKTIVESIGLYGAELWEVNGRNKSRIIAMEMNYWRRCCRLTRLDRVRNVDIRNEMEIDLDVIETIDAKRLNWLGHLQRMRKERWPKKAWEWIPSNRRKPGRPRLSWRDDVEEAMRTRGLVYEDCFDRRRWKLGSERRRMP